MELHCIIHQQSTIHKILKYEHDMKVVVSLANFVWSHRLNLCSSVLCPNAEYGYVLNHREVQWLRHGTMLKCFYAVRLNCSWMRTNMTIKQGIFLLFCKEYLKYKHSRTSNFCSSCTRRLDNTVQQNNTVNYKVHLVITAVR